MTFRKEALRFLASYCARKPVFVAPLCFVVLLTTHASAQNSRTDTLRSAPVEPMVLMGDSVTNLPPGIMLTEELSKVDPQKAAMYSAVLPGLGQIYNGQVWKVPVYYGTFVVLGHLIYTNNRLYNIFRQSLFAVIDQDPNTVNKFPRFTEASLRRNTDNFRRNRDYMVIIAGAVYVLNIADAHIGAHLREFDINDELTINYTPSIGNLNGVMYAGLGVTISF